MVEPEVATSPDAPGLLALREDAAEWMRLRGIRQWASGEVALAEVVEQVQRGEWLVVRGDATLTAAARVCTTDEFVWGHPESDALYVHGLVVNRRFVGRGLGGRLLAWVEHRAAAEGHDCVRLDCVEGNRALRAYYRAAGYREVGRRDFPAPWLPATLFEKSVTAR